MAEGIARLGFNRWELLVGRHQGAERHSNLDTNQTSSRIGGTISLPYSKHQSIKIAYSDGTYIRFGGNYQNVQVAWQYSWLGRPEVKANALCTRQRL